MSSEGGETNVWPRMSGSLWKLVVEGVAELQFFQVLVVKAGSVEEAAAGARDYLQRDGCRLVAVLEDETRIVSLQDIPPDWPRSTSSEEAVVAATGRIWVKPEDA